MFGDSGDETEGLYLIFVYLWRPCDDGDSVGDDGVHGDNVGDVSVFGQSMVFWRRTDDGDNFDDVQLEG